MAERLQLIRLGARGFDVYKLVTWWSDPETLTLAMIDEQYVTFVGAERETMLSWLQQVSLSLPT